MFVIVGATGHVGSATAEALLRDGHPVTAVTRDPANAERLARLGAEIAVADVRDVEAMRRALSAGTRLFLLNPPAAPNTDTDATEKATVRLLLEAIQGSKLETIVAQSTYGAQPGDHLGDLNTLFEMEEGLRTLAIPHSIIRAAYYMSNWDAMVEPARADGVLPTMYPADFELPMVAPSDLGAVAARLLLEPPGTEAIHYVEGPARYSPRNVADAFARSLGRPVEPLVTPRDQWEAAYRKLGFSETAARSYARMTEITADEAYETPDRPIRGTVGLQQYIDDLVTAG